MRAADLLQNLQAQGFSVCLESGHLAVSPASRLDDVTRELIQSHKSKLLQLLASEMAWPDANGDPVLLWCLRVVDGAVRMPETIQFKEGVSPVVVDPTEYIMDRLQVLRWVRSSIAIGGLGDWTPTWFTATAERLRQNLAALCGG